MAYTWTDGELITAEKLNNTGVGVLVVNVNVDGSTHTLDKTWKEIKDAYESGKLVICLKHEEGIGNANLFTYYLANCVIDAGLESATTYYVHFFNATNGTVNTTEYEANSENDYPTSGGLG